MGDVTLRDMLPYIPAVGLFVTTTLLLISLINERRNRRRDLSERVNGAVNTAVNEKFVTLFSGIFQAREQLASYVKEAEASAQMLEDRVAHGTTTLNDAVARVDASITSLEHLLAEANALAARLQQYEAQVSEDAREVSETRDRVFAQVEELSNVAQQFVLRTSVAEATLEAAGFTEETVTLDLPISDAPGAPVRPTTISCWERDGHCLTFCMLPGSLIPNGVESSVRFVLPVLERQRIDEGLVLVFDWDGDDQALREALDDVVERLGSPAARDITILKLEDLQDYLAGRRLPEAAGSPSD